MRKMIQNLKNHMINLPGWRTNRKIVVFESDDWGSIRMASKETYCRLSQKGYHIDSCPYNRNDALENNEDVAGLAEILHSVKDRQGQPVRFTLNNIVANPDFDRIKGTDFQAYFYEAFPTTLLRYTNSDRVMEIYRQGMAESVFQPQFHGREHVNVNRWLEDLSSMPSKKARLLITIAARARAFFVLGTCFLIEDDHIRDPIKHLWHTVISRVGDTM